MTTAVTVRACCSEDTEVVAILYSFLDNDTKEHILNHGDSKEFLVYDNRTIEVFERKKVCQ